MRAPARDDVLSEPRAQSASCVARCSRRAVVPALLAALLAAVANLVPSEALADVDAARRLFEEGIRLYQKGDWEGARRTFRAADAEHHAPPIVYNLALAEEKLGHLQAAVDAYEAYVAEVGDQGELASAAVVATAQIRARSTRTRVETKPAGLRAFVDGTRLGEATPTTVLLAGGHHVVVVEGEGLRAEQEIEARGAGDAMTVVVDAAPPSGVAEASQASGGSSASATTRAEDATRSAPSREDAAKPDGFVFGAAFAAVPCVLLGVKSRPEGPPSNARGASSILAGPTLDVGFVLSDKLEFTARGFVGIGPDAKPSWGFWAGPALSYRLGTVAWLGAAFLGGQIETRAHDARYGTDLVFGGQLEASIVVARKTHGEWLASVQPGFLLTEMRNDNTTFFFPVSFGYRAY